MDKKRLLRNTILPENYDLSMDDQQSIGSIDTDAESTKINSKEIKQTCRLCARICTNYVSIFAENNMSVAEKISRCLPIIVLSTDKLPLYVCKRCLYYLNISYKLVINSVKVDAFLRSQLEAFRKLDISKDHNNTRERRSLAKLKSDPNNLNMRIKEIKKGVLNGSTECDLCCEVFQDMDEFDNHIETRHLLKWRCNLCEKSFKMSEELILHKESKHAGNIIICNVCADTESSTVKDKTKEVIDTNFAKNTTMSLSVIKSANIPETCVNGNAFTGNSLDVACDICHATVDDDNLLVAHKRIHLLKNMYCSTCQTEWSCAYDLFIHKREAHNMYKKVQLKFTCNLCGKFFSNSQQWENHEENVCPKKFSMHSCKYCKSTFSTNFKLTRHLRKHKKEMFNDPTVVVYKCVACPKIFVDEEFYQKHRNVHDPECWDKFKCSLCNRPFRDNVRLKEHLRSIHEGVKPHQCDVCGKTFHRLSNMRVHRLKHFGHKCDHCNEVFEKLRFLVSHIQKVHGLESDLKAGSKKQYTSGYYVCRFCGKKLSTYQSVLNHERIHTGEKPYSCRFCEKTFRSYTSRWAHVQRHKKGNYVCEHCGKCFNYKQNLTTHMQVHIPMEDRKHQCSRCGKRFLRKSHLDVHTRIHDGIRPYTCDICCFSFTQLGDMRRHRARHANSDTRTKQPCTKSVSVSTNEDTN